jgi:hypothetical protein
MSETSPGSAFRLGAQITYRLRAIKLLIIAVRSLDTF